MLDVLLDHPDRALVAQVVGEELGGGVVLDHLVGEYPEPVSSIANRARSGLGTHPGAHHRVHDRIHLRLVELAERPGGLGGPVARAPTSVSRSGFASTASVPVVCMLFIAASSPE